MMRAQECPRPHALAGNNKTNQAQLNLINAQRLRKK